MCSWIKEKQILQHMQQPSFLLQLPFVLNCLQFHPSHQIKDHDEQIGGKEILNFKQKIKWLFFIVLVLHHLC